MFRVWGSGFRVSGLGLRGIQDTILDKAPSLRQGGCTESCQGAVSAFPWEALGGLGFRVQGLGFRV